MQIGVMKRMFLYENGFLLKNKARSRDSGVNQVQKVNNEKMYTTLNTTDNNTTATIATTGVITINLLVIFS